MTPGNLRRQGSVLVVMVGLSTILIGLVVMMYLQYRSSAEKGGAFVRQTQAFIMAQAMTTYLYPYWDKNRITRLSSYTAENTKKITLIADGAMGKYRYPPPATPPTSFAFTLITNATKFPWTRAAQMGQAYACYFNTGDIYVAGIGGRSYIAGDPSASSPGTDAVMWLKATAAPGAGTVVEWNFEPATQPSSLPASPPPPSWATP